MNAEYKKIVILYCLLGKINEKVAKSLGENFVYVETKTPNNIDTAITLRHEIKHFVEIEDVIEILKDGKIPVLNLNVVNSQRTISDLEKRCRALELNFKFDCKKIAIEHDDKKLLDEHAKDGEFSIKNRYKNGDDFNSELKERVEQYEKNKSNGSFESILKIGNEFNIEKLLESVKNIVVGPGVDEFGFSGEGKVDKIHKRS
jgi:hypothetical protein